MGVTVLWWGSDVVVGGEVNGRFVVWCCGVVVLWRGGEVVWWCSEVFGVVTWCVLRSWYFAVIMWCGGSQVVVLFMWCQQVCSVASSVLWYGWISERNVEGT